MKKLLSFILCLIMVVGVVSPAALMAAEDPEGSAVEEMIIEEPVFAEEPAAVTGEDLPEEIVPEVILPEDAAVLPEETEEAGVPETDAGAVIEETAGEQETGFIPETGPEEEVQITEEDPDGPDTQEVLPEELPGEKRAFPVSVIKSDNGQIAFVEREGLPQAEPAESEEVLEMRRFAPGTLVEIRALADEGYVLEEIRVLPEEPRPEGQNEYPLTGTEEGYAFPMPEEAVRVTARFAEEKIPEEDGKEAEEAEAEEELESAGSTSDTKVTGVKLDRTGQKVAVGKSFTLKAAVSPAGAANKKVTWKSSNTAVATVSSTGVVTGKKAGTATITVKTADGGKTAACKVTVVKPVTGVKLDKTKATIGSGESLVLKATVSPSDATDKKVTWKSSNTKIATVSSTGKVTAGASADGTAKITATTADGKKTATCTVTVRKPTVSYQTHVQNVGWQSYVKNGAMAGTQGKSLRLEGIRIRLGNRPYSGGISYRTHIQNIGWESSWKSDDAMSGTSGRSLRLEAIQIKLTGEMAKHYDVYYRVHAQNIGWMGWAMNGASAGTAGYSYRLEGIQIVLVRKGGSKPSTSLGGNKQNTSTAYKQKDNTAANLFNKIAGQYSVPRYAGYWSAVLNVGKDGSVTGNGFNSGMSSYAYYYSFSGKLTSVKKVDAYTYSAKLTNYKANNVGKREQVNGQTREYYDPGYNNIAVKIYLPGHKTSTLPEAVKVRIYGTMPATISQPWILFGNENSGDAHIRQ